MGLRKSRVKKGSPRVYNSVLFGVIDKAESTNQMRNREAGLLSYLDLNARKVTQTALLEAEYRKAQAIALARKNALHVKGPF